ncbi:putative short-chain dehydrogenase [Exophiala viscosa]|uniref:Short-chain dehydrogenase n=1 Tax=Exophiala viscosa TaxID=2486360 RepID=A0AAN6DSW0_9EURO|nr:putative short-chain dehydrogenase [Exophiala viscosa]
MTRDFAGKTAIVTGSARGIGAAIAIHLGQRGANVLVNYTSDRSKEAADQVGSKVSNSGARAAVIQADVSKSEGREAMVQRALELSGSERKIDILVHNAAVGDDCGLADLSDELYDRINDTNIKGVAFLTKAVLPHIARNGRIVLMSSIFARQGNPLTCLYSASKASLEAFARVWATELGQKYGVTVNCVNPGPVATDMWFSTDKELLDAMQPTIEATPAAPRVGEVEDIAPIVGFLCSEESRWVTGNVICANGGMLFH